MSKSREYKRSAYKANEKDKINVEDEQMFRFLRTPRCGENQIAALCLLDKHIKWLKIKVMKEYGEISNLVDQGELPEIIRPVPVGTPLAQEGPVTRGSASRV